MLNHSFQNPITYSYYEGAAALGRPWTNLGEPWSQLGGPQSQVGGPQSQLGGPWIPLGRPLSKLQHWEGLGLSRVSPGASWEVLSASWEGLRAS